MGRKKGKLSKGQPAGARSASGRLRNRQPQVLEPSIGVMRRRELHGLPAKHTGEVSARDRKEREGKQETDTCDALGRAFCAGLLGNGRRAQDLLLAGRKVAAQYWRAYGFLTPDSLARFQPQGPVAAPDPERDRIREDALNDALGMVRARGHLVRRSFDQLVIDLNPDHGPAWLDSIVFAHRQGRRAAERDYHSLELAIEGLNEIA
jgi:hypothetical protein